MPEMDGYAAAAAIRNELKLDVPIVAMTAHAMSGEKEKCLGYGMNDYISKPVREAELYAILKQHATGATQDRAAGVVNLSYLKDLSMGDSGFEQTIIEQFIIQIPEELKALQEAISDKNMLQIKSVAHGMKSSVSYMGLTERLHPILHRIESEAAGNEQESPFEEDFDEIKTVCEQAVVEAKGLVRPTLQNQEA